MVGISPTAVHMNVPTSLNAIHIIVYLGHIYVMANWIVLYQMMKKLAVNRIVYICFVVNTPQRVFVWMTCAIIGLTVFMERMSSCVTSLHVQNSVYAFNMQYTAFHLHISNSLLDITFIWFIPTVWPTITPKALYHTLSILASLMAFRVSSSYIGVFIRTIWAVQFTIKTI